MITPDQCRSARALLGWSQDVLVSKSGDALTKVHLSTFEKGAMKRGLSNEIMNKIVMAFTDAGIEFLEYDGVRRKPSGLRKLSGRDGLIEFFKDVYTTLKVKPTELVISGADEARLDEVMGAKAAREHETRMADLGTVRFRCLLREGDTNFIASEYGEYRWTPKENFEPACFYVYGDKYAVIDLSYECVVYIMDIPVAAKAYRGLFEVLWADALVPSGAAR